MWGYGNGGGWVVVVVVLQSCSKPSIWTCVGVWVCVGVCGLTFRNSFENAFVPDIRFNCPIVLNLLHKAGFGSVALQTQNGHGIEVIEIYLFIVFKLNHNICVSFYVSLMLAKIIYSMPCLKGTIDKYDLDLKDRGCMKETDIDS